MTAAILDMIVSAPVTRYGRTSVAWEVFDALTGKAHARGTAETHDAAELAAAKAITARTIRVQRATACWAVVAPGRGAVPLPLTPQATEAQALAYVRGLSMAHGLQVIAA
jgi:hypothetical protein